MRWLGRLDTGTARLTCISSTFDMRESRHNPEHTRRTWIRKLRSMSSDTSRSCDKHHLARRRFIAATRRRKMPPMHVCAELSHARKTVSLSHYMHVYPRHVPHVMSIYSVERKRLASHMLSGEILLARQPWGAGSGVPYVKMGQRRLQHLVPVCLLCQLWWPGGFWRKGKAVARMLDAPAGHAAATTFLLAFVGLRPRSYVRQLIRTTTARVWLREAA